MKELHYRIEIKDKQTRKTTTVSQVEGCEIDMTTCRFNMTEGKLLPKCIVG